MENLPTSERSLESTTTRREFLGGMAVMAMTLPESKEERWADIVAFLKTHVSEGVVPGAALIASKKGKIAFEHCIGTYYSLSRSDAPLTLEVRHPLFSFSKLISCTVVGMAVQEKLLDYNAPVVTYIPEFKGGGKEKITLRHLLTHSAGIPNAPLTPVHTEAGWKAFLEVVCGLKTEWEPGSRTAYHALTGLFVSAEAVRRVIPGKSWEQICRERLFDPIGAKSLTFALPPDSDTIALTPQPAQKPKTLADVFSMAGHPAGGCIGTPADALKVLQLHLNNGTWGRKRLLSRDILNEIHTVAYQKERDAARAGGKTPTHETWGLGPLLRGTGPSEGGHAWFGFQNQTEPGIFGHAGIDTVIGVADPKTGNALFFVTTNSPKPPEKTVPLRNGVTDRVLTALK